MRWCQLEEFHLPQLLQGVAAQAHGGIVGILDAPVGAVEQKGFAGGRGKFAHPRIALLYQALGLVQLHGQLGLHQYAPYLAVLVQRLQRGGQGAVLAKRQIQRQAVGLRVAGVAQCIQRALPFVIDLLTLSVEAGIDFMSGLQRAVERRKMDPLTEELIRMIHEIQLGASRRTALRNLAQRVNMPDMRSFAHALIQADELGVSIGVILRIQSDQMRQRRFDRAERLANEAPVKMLGPLMLFIFPAVFIVLLGPILARVAGNLL